ncbi:hypothetical protein BDK51DRAFT_45569, partial [Blyttiomyces helicus]
FPVTGPETWDDIETQATAILAGEVARGNTVLQGYTAQLAAYEGLTCNTLEWFASSGGGTFLDPDTGLVTVYNNASVAMVQRLRRWVTADIIKATGLFYSEVDAMQTWLQGNAVFMRIWDPWESTAEAHAAVPFPFGKRMLPGNVSTRFTVGYGVNAGGTNIPAAAKMASFLGTPASQRGKIYDPDGANNIAPFSTSIYSDPEVCAYVGQATCDIARTVTYLDRPVALMGTNWPTVSQLIFTAMHSILLGELDPDAGLQQLEYDIQTKLKQRMGAVCPDGKSVLAATNYWRDPVEEDLSRAFYNCGTEGPWGRWGSQAGFSRFDSNRDLISSLLRTDCAANVKMGTTNGVTNGEPPHTNSCISPRPPFAVAPQPPRHPTIIELVSPAAIHPCPART